MGKVSPGGDRQQFPGQGGQDAEVARGVVAEGVSKLRGHQAGIARLTEEVFQEAAEFFAAGEFGGIAKADAVAQGNQFFPPQPVLQTGIAGEDGAQQRQRVEPGAGHQPQFAEHGHAHFLGFVDEEHGALPGGFQMAEPAFPQGPEPGPAIMGRERDAEDVAHFPVEVADLTLGMGHGADGDIGESLQLAGEVAEQDAFAGSGIAVDHGKTALADQHVFDPPAEVGHARGDVEGMGGNFLGKRVPFQPMEGQQLWVHGASSAAVGR